MNRTPPSLALLVLFLASGRAGAAPRAQEQHGPPLLSLAEIVLDQYAVQNVDADDLYKLARDLAGRTYYVKEHGGFDSEPLSSMRLLGSSIILYDTREEVQRARDLLGRLDAVRVASSARVSVEFRPRFISLETANKAAESFARIRILRERGLIVLHDAAEDVDKALALLKRIDVPEKQVLLTCQLIEVGGAQPGPALPRELAENLQKLLPQSQFTQVGMAMLKTSVGGANQISLSLESPQQSYRLAFTPVAYDESSASLTVTGCRLMETEAPAPGRERELFRTDTILHGGEYTVLGATGATPRLLVLRVRPQG
jgi:hypothetical protein